MKPEYKIDKNSLPVLAAFIVFLFSAVFAAGYFFSRDQLKETMEEAEYKLNAIGHLKQARIGAWLKERMGDSRVIIESSEAAERFYYYSLHPGAENLKELKKWMDARLNSYNYENIFFFDAHLKLLLRSGGNQEKSFREEFYSLLKQADTTDQIIFSGLYKSSDKGNYDVDYIIPLSIKGKFKRRAGFIVLRSDPEDFLFPVLNNNLFYKSTSGTMLMQNIPGIMEMFNPADSIYGKVTSIPPIISDNMGESLPDTVIQTENEGRKIVMVINRVLGSSWYLVSTVDRAEIYAPIKRQEILILIIAGLFVAAASVGAGLIWRNRQAKLYKTLYQEQLEKEKINRELLKAEAKFKRLIENNSDVIALLDAEGNILYESPAIQKVLGYEPDELVGIHALDVLHPDELDYVAGLLKEVVYKPLKQIEAVMRARHKNGEWRFIEVDAKNQLEDEAVKAIVLNYRDITERVVAEKKIKELNSSLEKKIRERTHELETANRELEAFAYSVSHDLRAPLRSINGFSQALMEDYVEKLDDTARSYLSRVRAGSQRMGQLIDDILSLSRITRKDLELSDVDLSGMVRSIADELVKISPERKVEFVIEEGILTRGDKGLLSAALNNLLENAYKFTSKQAEARIEFGCTKADGRSICFVKDNGAGFDMKYADKLFTPFQRLHTTEDFPGTGIGLANVRKVIRRHGGDVWVKSEKNRGAAFYFTLHEKYTREHEEKSYTFS